MLRSEASVTAILLLGLAVGVMVGLMGVGGGVVLIPTLVYVMGMTQHVAQGTSLLLQLPPIGLGALLIYSKKGNVNWRAGWVCAAGFLAGGYFGSATAIRLAEVNLRGMFGVLLMFSAVMMLRQAMKLPQGGQAGE